MKCCIVLHNMTVEERERENGRPLHEQNMSTAIVGDDATPLWTPLIRTANTPPVPPHGSLLALCAANKRFQDIAEYHKIRKLVMDNLWQKYGEQWNNNGAFEFNCCCLILFVLQPFACLVMVWQLLSNSCLLTLSYRMTLYQLAIRTAA